MIDRKFRYVIRLLESIADKLNVDTEALKTSKHYTYSVYYKDVFIKKFDSLQKARKFSMNFTSEHVDIIKEFEE